MKMTLDKEYEREMKKKEKERVQSYMNRWLNDMKKGQEFILQDIIVHLRQRGIYLTPILVGKHMRSNGVFNRLSRKKVKTKWVYKLQ